MATLKFNEKINKSGEPIRYGQSISIDGEKLIGVSTNTLYVRKGFKNGTLFISQRGNGENGAGDICKIMEDSEHDVASNLFDRIVIFAEKAGAILTYDIHFNDSENSNSKGFKESLEYCKNYILQHNGSNTSYFEDYKGGIVSVVCNETGETIFETEVK